MWPAGRRGAFLPEHSGTLLGRCWDELHRQSPASWWPASPRMALGVEGLWHKPCPCRELGVGVCSTNMCLDPPAWCSPPPGVAARLWDWSAPGGWDPPVTRSRTAGQSPDGWHYPPSPQKADVRVACDRAARHPPPHCQTLLLKVCLISLASELTSPSSARCSAARLGLLGTPRPWGWQGWQDAGLAGSLCVGLGDTSAGQQGLLPEADRSLGGPCSSSHPVDISPHLGRSNTLQCSHGKYESGIPCPRREVSW